MPKLPVISGNDLIKFLTKKEGFQIIRQRGSHVRLAHNDGRKTVVPLHPELDRGTLSGILKQVKIDKQYFIENY